MNSLVTGCAGFIGSCLTERLLELDHEVMGIDCFIDYYSREVKERNLEIVKNNENFQLIPYSLLDLDLVEILDDVDYVFHQAAQAGVRHSWGINFEIYTRNNILATQKLLEACRRSDVKRVIYASSSSVYGDTESLPMRETDLPKPISPYGVSKLAGEHLCHLYCKNYDISSISLRYFTIYGPRQRPDMAFNKFIRAILNEREILVYGDGEQTRDFTYVDDAITANILAMNSDKREGVYNIGGGSRTTINNCIKILEEIIGKKAKVRNIEAERGDMWHTYADTSRAAEELGYKPGISLREGLEREVEWLRDDSV